MRWPFFSVLPSRLNEKCAACHRHMHVLKLYVLREAHHKEMYKDAYRHGVAGCFEPLVTMVKSFQLFLLVVQVVLAGVVGRGVACGLSCTYLNICRIIRVLVVLLATWFPSCSCTSIDACCQSSPTCVEFPTCSSCFFCRLMYIVPLKSNGKWISLFLSWSLPDETPSQLAEHKISFSSASSC